MADRRRPHLLSGSGSVLVLGLGRFGSSVARTLESLGIQVLAVDADPERVADLRDVVTSVAEADSTDVRALEQLGAGEFDRAVVAIGNDIESSLLTAAAVVDIGVKDVWAKAVSVAHGRILERIGVTRVVFPEVQMGERVAHLVAGRLLDFLPLDAGFALVEATAPPSMTGRSLGELGVRSRYGVTVVCVKPAGGQFTYATADTVLGPGDVIVVAGATADAEAFAAIE